MDRARRCPPPGAILLALLAAAPASAQEMDAEHAADAAVTRRLNRDAAARREPVDDGSYARAIARYEREGAAHDANWRDYEAARRRYEAELARWRRARDRPD